MSLLDVLPGLGGGRGATSRPRTLCRAVSRSGGFAVVENPFGSSVCRAEGTSGGQADALTTCLALDRSGGRAEVTVLCRGLGVSGGRAVIEGRTVFDNGYSHRMLVAITAQNDLGSEVMTDHPYLIRRPDVAAFTRASASGGRVQHPQGFDIRLESLDGARLDHQLLGWSAAGGAAGIRVRRTRNARDLTLAWLYAGKAGLSATEESVAGVWRGAAYAVDVRTGADLTGRGFDLSPVTPGAISNATLLGLPAASFTASAALRRSSPTLANGLARFSWELAGSWAVPAGEANLARIGGAGTGTAATSFFWDDPSPAGNADAWSVGCNITQGASTGNVMSSGLAGSARAGFQHLHGVYAPSAAPALWIGEERQTTTLNGALRSGTIEADTGDNLSIGAGTGAQTLAVPGTYLVAVFWPTALTEAWIRTAVRCLSDPDRITAAGAVDAAPDALPSALALPVSVESSQASLDVDVAAAAHLPSGATAPALQSVNAPGNGTATIIAGKVRLTRAPGFTGADRCAFTLVSGGKTTRSIILVTWLPLAGGGGEDELPAPSSTLTVGPSGRQFTSIQAALSDGRAVAGCHIIVDNGTYAGFSSVRAGAQAGLIVVKARNRGQARITGKITLGHAWNAVEGLDVDGENVRSSLLDLAAQGCRSHRCLYRRTPVQGKPGTISVAISAPDCRFTFNRMVDIGGRGCSVNPFGLRAIVRRNDFFTFLGEPGTNAHEKLQVGLTATHTDVNVQALVEWNLFRGRTVDHEIISVKSRGNTIRFNTVLGDSSHAVGTDFRNRHGEQNRWHANFIRNSGGIAIFDRGNELLGNVLVGTFGRISVRAGTATADQWDDDPGGGTPAATDTIVAGNTANSLVVGFQEDASTQKAPARNTRVEAHTGARSFGLHAATPAYSPVTSRTIPTAAELSAGDVGPDAAPV